jgi:hypothetical protein
MNPNKKRKDTPKMKLLRQNSNCNEAIGERTIKNSNNEYRRAIIMNVQYNKK